jgi:opacity protein-like surface antigen
VDFGSDNGWGFSLGYNFDEHLSLGIEITANNSDYSVVFEDKNGDIKRFDHNADFYSTTFNLRYHFLEGPVQPFIMAGLGWTSVDSNISTGKGYCVPDYYWGWYCYQTSYSETGMSYSTAAGVRVELPNRLFLRASYGMQWLNEDIGDDSTNFDVGLLELGIVF